MQLEAAKRYLATRARTQTPLGAAEFLDYTRTRERESFDKRMKVALECMTIYRVTFPDEYQRSSAPRFSLQREQQLYRLLSRNLFPVMPTYGIDVEVFIDKDPHFFLPFIPLRGIQPHLWAPGEFEFSKLELPYQLAHVLSDSGAATWDQFVALHDLDDCPRPLPPIGTVGWSMLMYSCSVEETPLRWMPITFHLITYRTNNPWLDLPQIATVGFDWSLPQVLQLHLDKSHADDTLLAVHALSSYMREDPKARIKRVITIWNDAAEKELQGGFEGLLRDEQTLEWVRRD